MSKNGETGTNPTPNGPEASSSAETGVDPGLTVLLTEYRSLLADRAGLDRQLDELEHSIMESEPLNPQSLKAIRSAFTKSLKIRHNIPEDHPIGFLMGLG